MDVQFSRLVLLLDLRSNRFVTFRVLRAVHPTMPAFGCPLAGLFQALKDLWSQQSIFKLWQDSRLIQRTWHVEHVRDRATRTN